MYIAKKKDDSIQEASARDFDTAESVAGKLYMPWAFKREAGERNDGYLDGLEGRFFLPKLPFQVAQIKE
jgi:hypothetical protein